MHSPEQRPEAFLDSVVENIPSVVFVKDAKDLRYVRCNRAMEELLGISRHELIGKTDHDLFPMDVADRHVSNDKTVLRTREPLDIPNDYLDTKMGRRTLRTRKIPILNANGEPEYVLGIVEDMTDAKNEEMKRLELARAQVALEQRSRENEIATFLAEASTILASSLEFRKNLRELARLTVPTLADWCTITIVHDDLIKERIAIVHRDPGKTSLAEELAKSYPAKVTENESIGHVLRTGESHFTPVVFDSNLVAIATDQRHLEIMRSLGCSSSMIVPLLARGKVLGAICLVSAERRYDERDLELAEELGRRAGIVIDNALLYESAQRAVRARDEFLSVASHELQTPLTALKLQSQLRARDVLKNDFRRFSPENIRRFVEQDVRQVNRLVRLVDDMLDVSRIQTGKLSISREQFDLREMARDTLTRFSAHLESRGISVRMHADEAVVGSWDRFRLEQVLVNLLTNALKYGNGKPIEISVHGERHRALMSVVDHGIGIAEKDQARIFEQFERAVSAGSVSGLGLGLFISKKIVEAHGGHIEVESQPGFGSRFTVDLPWK